MRHDPPAGERALTAEAAPAPGEVGAEQPLAQGFLDHTRSSGAGEPAWARLRAALRSLALAVGALHARGEVHGAIDAATAKVDPEGTVTLLDPSPARDPQSTPADDWSAVGALLYAALTGKPPRGEASPGEAAEHAFDPPDPRLLALDLPTDLAELAVDLLRAPARRPRGAAILAALGLPRIEPGGTLAGREDHLPFVGRADHLAALDEAFASARSGEAVTVLVHGGAGVGKSALLRRFVDRVAARGGALVLEGRGLGPLTQALAEHLRGLPDDEIRTLCPSIPAGLGAMCPALLAVPALARAPSSPPPPDPREQRREAVAALRALVHRLSRRAPLILVVDDVDHCSTDTTSALTELVEPGERPFDLPPAALLLLAYRSEHAGAIASLRTLRRRLARGERVGDVRELLIDPLAGRDAQLLARLLAPGRLSDEERSRLALASEGNPRRLRALLDPEGAPYREPLASPPSEAPERAGDEALAALAFGDAAALYQGAIADDPAPSLALRDKLTRALALAGREDEAGVAALTAAAASDPAGALERRGEAAALLLDGGQIAQGTSLAAAVLVELDRPLAASATRAIGSLLVRRAQVALRGLGFKERAEVDVHPGELRRLDRAHALAQRLGGIDPVRATELDARLLVHALRVGEPSRVARALAVEALAAATEGGARGRERAPALIARALDLARALPSREIEARVTAAASGVAFLAPRLREAIERAEQAIALLRTSAEDATPAASAIEARWLFPSLYLGGDLRELARRVPYALRAAEQQGTLAAVTALRVGPMARVHLVLDRPVEALLDAAAALRAFAPTGFNAAHLTELLTRASVHLYDGDAPRAADELRLAWPALERSHLLRAEATRIEAHALRGAASHAAARWSADREAFLRVAERDARLLRKEDAPLATAWAELIDAGVARGRGRIERALDAYERAAHAFNALEMPLASAAARRRRGELLGGDEGRALMRDADTWMIGQSVCCPERLAAMIAPS